MSLRLRNGSKARGKGKPLSPIGRVHNQEWTVRRVIRLFNFPMKLSYHQDEDGKEMSVCHIIHNSPLHPHFFLHVYGLLRPDLGTLPVEFSCHGRVRLLSWHTVTQAMAHSSSMACNQWITCRVPLSPCWRRAQAVYPSTLLTIVTASPIVHAETEDSYKTCICQDFSPSVFLDICPFFPSHVGKKVPRGFTSSAECACGL